VFGRRMMIQKMIQKMATVNTLESKNHKNEAKMHSTWSSAVLASTWHIQTPP
jgi:hypothetical protein